MSPTYKHFLESLYEDRVQTQTMTEAAGDPTKVDALKMSHSNLRNRLQLHMVHDREAKRTAEPSKYHPYPYVADVYGDHSKGEVIHESDGKLFRSSFKCSSKDGKHTVSMSTPVPVTPRVAYDEIPAAGASGPPNPGMVESFRRLDSGMLIIDHTPTTPSGDGDADVVEADLTLDVVALQEAEFAEGGVPNAPPTPTGTGTTGKFVAEDGTCNLRIITPGWGSSGYYPADMLKRDGPRIFKEGLQMFWNHDTPEEAASRPEGDLTRLAATLHSNAYWDDNGPAGKGLYAKAKVKKAFREAVDDLAPDIGVSIRAGGAYKIGEAEGKRGPIIQTLSKAKSTDFVTLPGRGGKILEIFESYRTKPQTRPEPESEPVPVAESKGDTDTMTDEQKKQLVDLTESNRRLQERLVLQEASTTLNSILALPANRNLHPMTQSRLRSTLVTQAPVKEGVLDTVAFTTLVTEAIKEESAYVATLTGSGRPVAMGSFGESARSGGDPAQEDKDVKAYEASIMESFKDLGYDDTRAKHCTTGRRAN